MRLKRISFILVIVIMLTIIKGNVVCANDEFEGYTKNTNINESESVNFTVNDALKGGVRNSYEKGHEVELVYVGGVWRASVNGVIDEEYTGIGTNKNGTFYVKDGTIKFDYTDTYYEGDKAYIIEKNRVYAVVPKNTTEIIKINDNWRMVKEGKVDYSYNGIGTNKNGTFYVKNGTIKFDYTDTYYEGDQAYIIEKNRVYTVVPKNTTEIIKINDSWRMVKEGKVDYNYNGIGTNKNGTFYVKNGTIKFDYTGLYTNETGTYYIVKSRVFDSTEIVYINNAWRMVKEGKVDYSYNGIGTNKNGTWYVHNGTIKFDYTDTYYEGDQAYIIEKNRVYAVVSKNTTEIIKINNSWRMVKEGKVDYNYNGIGTNKNGTFYVKNGTIKFDYTGLYMDETGTYDIVKNRVSDRTEIVYVNNAWRMLVNGKIDYNYNGLGTNKNGTFYVKDGTIKFDYTDTYYEGDKAYIIEKNRVYAVVPKNTTEVMHINGNWRMVKEGKVYYNYSGLGSNKNGTWYVHNGTINFDRNDSWIEGDDAYIFEKNKVYVVVPKNTTEVMYINGNWRMVKDGRVDYKYNGLGTNKNGTWYVKDGTIKFDYTGIYKDNTGTYIVEKNLVPNKNIVQYIESAWRMVVNGKVDYQYTGIGENENGTWYVKDGTIDFKFSATNFVVDGNTYNIVNNRVMDIVNIKGFSTSMKLEQPVNNAGYILDSMFLSGWALSDQSNDSILIYVDGKYVGKAVREKRTDIAGMYANGEYGGSNLNPNPGFYFDMSKLKLTVGKHKVKVVNAANDGVTIMQSREVDFKIDALKKSWGIDVSHYQGKIDWDKVKQSGVTFAILKIGEYWRSRDHIEYDQYFERNYAECKRLGIAVGGYFYSYAFNKAEALEEVNACLKIVQGKKFELPIFYDVEDKIVTTGVANGFTNRGSLTNAAITFCDTLIKNGFKAGVYSYKYFLEQNYDMAKLEKYSVWLAHYTDNGNKSDYSRPYDFWQYTSSGKVKGISGNVDLNYYYIKK